METKLYSVNELQFAQIFLTININPGYDDIGYLAIKKNTRPVYVKTL